MVPAQLAPKEQGACVGRLLKPLVSFELRRCACAWMVVRYSRLLRPVAGIGDMTSVRQRKGSRGKESQPPAEPHSQPTICCSDHQPESSSFLGEWTFIQPAAALQPPGGSGATLLHHHPPPSHQYHQALAVFCATNYNKAHHYSCNMVKSLKIIFLSSSSDGADVKATRFSLGHRTEL